MQGLFECKAMWCSRDSPLKSKWDRIAGTVAADIKHRFPTAGLVSKLSEEEYVPSWMIAAFHHGSAFVGKRKLPSADESHIAVRKLMIDMTHHCSRSQSARR
jgi:hypothetical protein